MEAKTILRLSSIAMILAGALRAFSAIIPFDENRIELEILYFIIDIGFLFSLIGLYSQDYRTIGKTGFLGFFLAIVGIALIVGPDGSFVGLAIYPIGAFLFSLGIILYSIVAQNRGSLTKWVYRIWFITLSLSIIAFFVPQYPLLFITGSFIFGLSYSIGGIQLYRLSVA